MFYFCEHLFISLQLFFMLDQKENLLLKYAKKIRNDQHFQKILQRQDMTFDYKPFKIDKLTPEKALKTYESLHHRYYISKELAFLSDSWHEYEKRLFVWFMVIYAYYLEKENSTPGFTLDYRQRINFSNISRIFFDKNPIFLEFQFLNLFKIIDKMVWTQKDDTLLTNAVKKCPKGKWTEVSIQIFISSSKEKFISSKNCRQRWQNHLDTSTVKGNWTSEEDLAILQCVLERYGKKWSKMKHVLGHRRTQHMIKNRYHSLITKHKISRYDKETDIAKRLMEKLRAQQDYEDDWMSLKQPNNDQNVDQQVELKIQNHSSESSSKMSKVIEAQRKNERSGDIASSHKKQILIKEEEKNKDEEKNILDQNQCPRQNQAENNDGDYFFPFNSYTPPNNVAPSYDFNQYMYEIHKNQMMFYQQFLNCGSVIPTAETYMSTFENQTFPGQSQDCPPHRD